MERRSIWWSIKVKMKRVQVPQRARLERLIILDLLKRVFFIHQNQKSIPEEKIIETETVNEDQLNALNQALEEKLEEIINTEEVVNEELLDSLIAALNFKENQNFEETIDVIFDSSFKIKSKPKPNQKVVISALTDSLTGQIESMTSYDPNQSAFIQVGAFKKESVSDEALYYAHDCCSLSHKAYHRAL